MSRRSIAALALVAGLVACAAPASAQSITRPPSGDNQKSSVTQNIGLVTIRVSYSSPNVHGPNGEDRRGHIWGELVPYGLSDLQFNDCKQCPWRGGANENTVFTTSHEVMIEGQPLAAGAYGVHFIPGREEWTVIFSRNSTSWGSFTYDPAEDALRVRVSPAECAYHEWLDYEFTDRETDHATLALQWENLQVPIRITVPKIKDYYVEQMGRELRGSHWFTWTNWDAAAQYCLENQTHLEKGLEWAQHAVTGEFVGSANFQTLTTLAQLQIANGRRDDASKSIAQALGMSGLTPVQLHGFGRGLQGQGERALAAQVYEGNAKRFPNQWPVAVGLARASAIRNDFRKAVGYARQALKQAPDEQNRRNLEALIKEWEAKP